MPKIVILLHGYGHNGADFLDNARPFLSELQGAVLLSPNAPHELDDAAHRCWFALDKMTYYELREGLERAAPPLLAYINEAREKHGSDDVNLVGFSQGAMMCFEMLFHAKLSKIVAYSGLFAPPIRAPVASPNAEVLIVHSADDAVVPYSNAELATKSLDKFGVSSKVISHDNIGHSISPAGWRQGVDFLR